MCGGNQIIRQPRAADGGSTPSASPVRQHNTERTVPGQSMGAPAWHPPLLVGQGHRIDYRMGQPAQAPVVQGPRAQSGETHQAGDTEPSVQHDPIFLPLNEHAVGFDATRPWIARAQPGVNNSNVSLELYGLDISEAEVGPANAPVIQNLLQPHQQEAFRRQMEARLANDLDATKSNCFQVGC